MPIARMPYSTPLYGWQLVNQLFFMSKQPDKETWIVTSARLTASSIRQRLLGGKNYITSLDVDPADSPFREPIHRLTHHITTHLHSVLGAEIRRKPMFNKIVDAYVLAAYPRYWQYINSLYILATSPLNIKAETFNHDLDEDQQHALTQFLTFMPVLAPTVVGPHTIFARRL